MRLSLLFLMLAFVLVVRADEPPEDPNKDKDGKKDLVVEVGDDTEWKDSKELMRDIQGINEDTVWIVQFHDNDPEDSVF